MGVDKKSALVGAALAADELIIALEPPHRCDDALSDTRWRMVESSRQMFKKQHQSASLDRDAEDCLTEPTSHVEPCTGEPREIHVLIAEDDGTLARGLQESLRHAGYIAEVAATGIEADQMLCSKNYQVVTLDLGLPGMDGLEVLRRMRERGIKTPVLIVTARDSVEDRADAFKSGADDYMVKPFALAELEERIAALLKHTLIDSKLVCGPLVMARDTHGAWLNGRPLTLPYREWRLLELLVSNSGQVVSKGQIVTALGNRISQISSTAIEAYASRLHRKLARSGIRIEPVRGLGYILLIPTNADAILKG